jgi:tetratricopeptide (TPR) repeat protein
VQAKEYKKAMLALRNAEQRDPRRADIAFYLGVALFEQGLPAEAAGHFRRATKLEPGYALAYFNLGQCLKATKDRAGAIAAFRSAVQYQPHHAQAHTELGELLAADEPKAAITALRTALDLDPDDARARKLLTELDPPKR